MDEGQLRRLLEDVRGGKVEVAEALRGLKDLPYQDLGYARVDHHRELRQGVAEVVFGAGKTPAQVAGIMASLAERSRGNLLVTRASREAYQAVREVLPEAEYHEMADLIALRRGPQPARGRIAVISAGTSDLPVAEEAALTAEVLGNKVERLYDAGVAGIHRLLAHHTLLEEARVLVAVAGMEGALPSVVGGLVNKPVIAVPTSTGYGASFHGLAALLAMLNSCAPGVAVVNIDNGFGAGFLASRINQM